MSSSQHQPFVGVLIRTSNSEKALLAVLSALARQTKKPDEILGVTNGSSDQSSELLPKAGARILKWKLPYHHSKVLNFGCSNLKTDLILILSSHTVLESPDALEKLVESFKDSQVACASARWDKDPCYSDTLDWKELKQKGLRFGSIYSNSMGMIRRSFSIETPFDESIDISEDYAWALDRLKKGNLCRRLDFPFSYQRPGSIRNREFADVVFQLSSRHELPVTWLGPLLSLKLLLRRWGQPEHQRDTAAVRDRLYSWLSHRTQELSTRFQKALKIESYQT